MGRKRIISEAQILDAAARVVARSGAGQLTIEAVASEAGISKASVLYLFKTKRALIKAVIDRWVEADAVHNEAAISSLGQVDDAVIRGRILAAAGTQLTDEVRFVALNLSASLANDGDLRRSGRDYIESMVTRLKRTSTHPKGAMLAHLALEGLKLLELLDLQTWTVNERKHLMRDIEWLSRTDPQPSVSSFPVGGTSHDEAKQPSQLTHPKGRPKQPGQNTNRRDELPPRPAAGTGKKRT